MKLLSIPTLFFIISIFSCRNISQIKVDSSNEIKISIPTKIEEIRLGKYSDIFDSIRIVKLETNNQSMIGRIDRIIAHGDKYFILDQVERKAVIEFDSNGKFLKVIGEIGSGKGKYKEPNDISISNDQLVVWVNNFQKFLIYDMNGNFLKEVRVKSFGKSGAMLNDGSFALYMDIGGDMKTAEAFDLKIFNSDGDQIHTGFEKLNKDFSRRIFFFSQNNGQTLISPGYSSYIYSLTNNTLSKKYQIDFGEKSIPENSAANFVSLRQFIVWLNKSEYAYLSTYHETDGFLIFNFSYHASIYTCFYSKKSRRLKFANSWFNNVNGFFPGVVNSVCGNNVISYYDPSTIDTYKKGHQAPTDIKQAQVLAVNANKYFMEQLGQNINLASSDFHYSQKQIDLLNSIQPSDNPILLVQRLKEF